MSLTLESRVGIGDTGVGIQTLEVVGGISPHLVAVGHRAVVVAEAIPLVDDAVGVEEVYLTLRGIATEVTLGELIYVISEVCSEEVTYLSIVGRAIVTEVDPCRQL